MINGRKGFREHNREHNVTFAEDFKETWQKERREREAHYLGTADRERRRDAIRQALEKLNYGR